MGGTAFRRDCMSPLLPKLGRRSPRRRPPFSTAKAMAKTSTTVCLMLCGLVAALPVSIVLSESNDRTLVENAVARRDRPAADRRLDADRQPRAVLEIVHAQPGERVLDVLASPGYYSELLAGIVGPRGQVVAYDPPQFVASPGARSNWADRIRRWPNIRQDLQPLHSATFGTDSFDIVLLHLAYHETYWESERYGLKRMVPRTFARMLHRALRPGGRAVVIDHVAMSGSEPRASVDRFHRIDPVVVIDDFEAAGFRLLKRSEILANPKDDHERVVFDPSVRGRTDRMVLIFGKTI
jgi:predicted methyltransferase